MEIDARTLLCTALAALALAGVGCGSDDEGSGSEPSNRVAEETVDPLPELPKGWRPVFSRVGGFGFGLPPAWTAQPASETITTLVRSPKRLVAVSISADRTDEALALPPDTYAERTLGALPGFEGGIWASGEARPYRHRYEGAEVTGTGVAEHNNVPQDLRVVVLRRDRMATLIAVIAASARGKAAAEQRLALDLVRTLRSRPVEVGVTPESR